MHYLVLSTILWAFSFSLIGEYLSGKVDIYMAILVRLFLATLVFIPFLKLFSVRLKLVMQLMGIGALQIGIMYILLYGSYSFLSVPELLLFTITTPFYITLIYDFLQKRFRFLYLISVFISIFGAFIIRYDAISRDFIVGFLLIQAANICFAIGQVYYKIIMEKNRHLQQKEVFAYFNLGAFLVIFVASLFFGDFSSLFKINSQQWIVLLWLGIIASGIGYFWWNKGLAVVDSGVLAIMNNALIPAGIIVNVLIWNKTADFFKLSLGGSIILVSLAIHYLIMKYYDSFAISNKKHNSHESCA